VSDHAAAADRLPSAEIDGFVGRSSELGTLRTRWEAATRGTPSPLLVEGEGGSGKTTLLATFQQAATCARVVQATGDELERPLRFGILDTLLPQLESVNGAAAPTAREARIEVAAAPRDALTEGARLLGRIQDVAGREPLLVVLDDAHLADADSLDALRFALRRLRTEPVLLVFAARPEASASLVELTKLVDAQGTRIVLKGLTVEDVQELARSCGLGSLSRRAAARLQAHTEGNPLHLRALLTELTAAEAERLDVPLPAPRSLGLLIRESLAAMSQPAQRLAAAAAVLGPAASLSETARLARVADPLAPVDELQRGRIITLPRSSDGYAVRFRHPLVRAAVYDGIAAAERSELHHRAALQCRGLPALRHRVAAALMPDPQLVTELTAEADLQRAAGSWGRAAELLLDAARLTDPGDRRGELLVEALDLLLVDGDVSAAISLARDAVLPDTVRGLSLDARISWLAGDHPRAFLLAQQAWQSAAALDPRTRDGVAAMLSQMCIMSGDNAEAARWAQSAIASGLLAPDLESSTRGTGAVALALVGRLPEGLALLPGSGPAHSDPVHPDELRARGMLRLWSDDLAGAVADLRASLPTPGAGPGCAHEPTQLVALGYLAEAEFRSGNWDAAVELAAQTAELVEDTGQRWLAAFAHALAAFVPAGRGQWAEAEAQVTAAQRAARELGDHPSWAYANNAAVHLAACRRDAEGVLAAAEPLLQDRDGVHHEPGLHGWAVLHAAALVERGQLEEARCRIAELQARAEVRGVRSQLSGLARVQGELAAARQDRSAARYHFQRALELGEGCSSVLDLAVSEAAFGRFLRRRGEGRAALGHLMEAQRRFAALGATPFRIIAEQELAAVGPAAGAHPGVRSPLTAREEAVADLVCAGLTNREVAQQLQLSVKTVSYHLSHVYAKLGLASRTQLMARRGVAGRGT
jgi:ATP/maltotriose-dependent transcriptional regulator MalT